MKNNSILSGLMLIAALTLTTNCVKETPIIEKTGVPFSLNVDITKTSTADGSTFSWTDGDAVTVFHAEAGSTTYGSNDEFTLSAASANSFNGTLSDGALSADAYDWYVFYPYTSQIQTPANTNKGYRYIGSSSKSAPQVQDGNNSKAHLAGQYFPLYGKVTNVAKDATPSITLKQALTVVQVHVTNTSGNELVVSNVSFQTPTNTKIIGSYYIGFSGDTPTFTPSGDSYVSNIASLTVNNGAALANNASADFYIALAPFTAAVGDQLVLSVNGYEKAFTVSGSDISFASGRMKTLNFAYDHTETPASLPFSIDGTDGSAAYSNTTGLSAYGLGSDYTSHSPYMTRFDDTGDYIQIFFDKPAGTVSFGVKKIGGSNTSTFTLSGSTNGASFTDIESFSVTGAQNSIQNYTSAVAINANYRYLRLTFTKGSNVGLGDFSVSTVSTDPVINANNINDVPAIGVTNAGATYTVSHFTDDVEVGEFTGCVTDAIAMDGDIVYSVGPNYKTTAESGTIVLWSASDHSITKTIQVAQLKSTLSVSATSITIPASASTASFTVTTAEFGYNAVVASTEDGRNLSITSGASGSASSSAQTVTVSSTTAAPTSGDAIVLGTISVYRNSNTDDSQKKTITILKAVDTGSTACYRKVTTLSEGNFLFVADGKAASSTGGGLAMTAVTIVSDAIASDSTVDAYAITIASLGSDQYSLKMGSNYIGYNSSTNLKAGSSVANDSFKWTITMESDGTAYIVNVGTNTRFIGANAGFTQFKAYATSNKGTYAQPTLYKYMNE